jgi:branched-chain amino acid transport system permease protein
MVFSAVLLALASLGVAALRLSRFGRRLIALCDSEAAYATLGGSPLFARVLVFGLSAGIAGVGGVLYGMQLQSVTAEQFTFVAGLPIFLIAVIGGLGSVGGGLFTGIAYLGPIHLVSGSALAGNLVHLLPALAGLGFARHPEGIVPGLRRGWEPLARSRAALSALLGGFALLWLLCVIDVIGNVLLLLGTAVLALALRAWARSREKPAVEQDVPIEWRGVRRPWRREDEEVLARGIAGGR